MLDAHRGLKMFEQIGVRILGIVENMSYFVPPKQPHISYDIFGSGGGEKVSQELDAPLLGCIPLEIALREAGDRGFPILISHPDSVSAKALHNLASNIAAQVSVAALT